MSGSRRYLDALGSFHTMLRSYPTRADIAVTGYGTDCDETPIVVVAGPFSYNQRLDIDLVPGVPEQLSTETLYLWFGTEVVRTWPFNTHTPWE